MNRSLYQILQDGPCQRYEGVAYETRERALAGAAIAGIYDPTDDPVRFGKNFDALLYSGLAVLAKTLRLDPSIDKEQALAVLEKAIHSEIDGHCASVNEAAFKDYQTDGLTPIDELMRVPGATPERIERARLRAAGVDTEAKRIERIREALNMGRGDEDLANETQD